MNTDRFLVVYLASYRVRGERENTTVEDIRRLRYST